MFGFSKKKKQKKFKNANEMFESLGFKVVREQKQYGIVYQKYIAEYGYIHEIDIMYKTPFGVEPYILVQSYQSDNDAMVGLKDDVLEACLFKIEEMKKYAREYLNERYN